MPEHTMTTTRMTLTLALLLALTAGCTRVTTTAWEAAALTGECLWDSDCAVGEVCLEATCETAWVACDVTADCPADHDCAAGACLFFDHCYTDAHCDPHELCDGGMCATRACSPEEPCPDGAVCKGGGCASIDAECTADSDCGGGEWCEDGACVAPVCPGGGAPAPELCNGADDECDGLIDEAFPSKGTGCKLMLGVGIEILGTFVCREDGLGTECFSAKLPDPVPEVCDGQDNNLNGLVDEDFPIGLPCTLLDTPCSPLGIYACTPEGDAVTCVHTVELLPGAEVCDGQDNNCDGNVDEDFPDLGQPCMVGSGPCVAFGHLVCGPAGEVICDGAPQAPSPEVCDGADNDCDGLIDEDFGPLGDPCTAFSEEGCSALGTWICASDLQAAHCDHPPFPAELGGPDVCDAMDNDCDGEVDEDAIGVGDPCGPDTGECSEGVRLCVGGAMLCVGATGPEVEVCNAADDDCDGADDDGLVCQALGEACAADAECMLGYCAWDTCTIPCVDVGHCPDGFGCVQFSLGSRFCFPDCATDADCAAGWFCQHSALEAGCVLAGPAGYGEACVWNSDCATGDCVNGVCSDECQADSECPGPTLCVTYFDAPSGFCEVW